MAKNTGKKRKRKNVRLHRTVRKTIAAIFMIMAVVVAAIPVEQLGTMQAKTTDVRNLDIKSVFEQVYNASDMNIKMESVLTVTIHYLMQPVTRVMLLRQHILLNLIIRIQLRLI